MSKQCASEALFISVPALQDNHKLSFIQQLRHTQTVQPRIKLKLFGHSGAGKSSLLESLKCGILRGLFRRKRTRLSSGSRHPNSPVNSKPAGRPERSLPDYGAFSPRGEWGGFECDSFSASQNQTP